MPSYKLKHGAATGDVDCGSVVISQANNQTTVSANPPGGGSPQDITSQTTYAAKAGGNGTIMNPAPGDTINFGTYSVSVGPPPSSVSYSFNSNATYRAAGAGQKAGYFTSATLSPAGGLNDWEASDPGK
jgi:hypothetical protein